MSGARRTVAAFFRNRTGVLGAAILFGVVAFCVLVPLVSPYDPNAADFTAVRESPSGDHWLGTDQYGRDILTRIAAGGRTTLLIAGAALGVILVLGVGYGATSGIFGGRVDAAMMRLLDGLLAIPRLPVSIVILVFVGLQAQNVQTVVLALAIVNWMITARLVRGEVVLRKQQEYVRAAQALGAGRAAVARRHIVPNALGIVVVAIFLELPGGDPRRGVPGGPRPRPRAAHGDLGQHRPRGDHVRSPLARLPAQPGHRRPRRGRKPHGGRARRRPRPAALAGAQSAAVSRPEGPRAGAGAFLGEEWRGPESNRRHHGFQPCALPTELPRRGTEV